LLTEFHPNKIFSCLKAAVEDLIAKVAGGKSLEAFDRYYADDVTMQENEQPPRIGGRKNETPSASSSCARSPSHDRLVLPQRDPFEPNCD
jgi:hypothetical protein